MGELILAGVEWRYLQDLTEPFCDSHFTDLFLLYTERGNCRVR